MRTSLHQWTIGNLKFYWARDPSQEKSCVHAACREDRDPLRSWPPHRWWQSSPLWPRNSLQTWKESFFPNPCRPVYTNSKTLYYKSVPGALLQGTLRLANWLLTWTANFLTNLTCTVPLLVVTVTNSLCGTVWGFWIGLGWGDIAWRIYILSIQDGCGSILVFMVNLNPSELLESLHIFNRMQWSSFSLNPGDTMNNSRKS